LLQRPLFTAGQLDAIADSLGMAQRNRLLPFFFAGNWDINTLMAALAPLELVGSALELVG